MSIDLSSITRESPFSDDLFLDILGQDDIIERAKRIEDVRRRCKTLGRITEFNNLLKAWTQRAAQLTRQKDSNCTEFTDAPLVLKCGKYIATDAGVYLTDVNSKTGEMTKMSACPHPILPVERLVNLDTDTEKLKIAFFKDARWREICVDCGMAFNKAYISQLADRGVIVTSESAKDLVKYLSETVSLNLDTLPLYRSISRLGWINEDFAPYVQDIRYDGDADFKSIYEHVCECGSLLTWLEHVSELRRDINIRLMLDASFASVLISKVGALPFVLHLWGTTGFGKTVSLMVAASIWGNPDMGRLTRSMNMTANAMARTAAFLYSVPFCADELQQIKDRWGTYDALIMYLCEGIDRGRAKAHGGVEQVATWRNAFIFTGEEPVTKASSGGGVKNRCIELEVKDRIVPDGNYTANLVKGNYGHAGKRFVQYVQGLTAEQIQADYKAIFTEIIESCDTTDKQAMSMALIMLADKYSCQCIFAGTPLDVSDIAGYLVSTHTVDAAERAYAWTVNWVAENSIRFDTNSDNNKGAVWGKITGGVAMINKNVLTEALARAGFDFVACSRKWTDKKYLLRNSQGYIVHQTSLQGIRANYIKLALPDETDGREFTDVTEQQELPFK